MENETSFIYGRNPNITPVPIYAVVTLCHEQIEQTKKQQSMQIIPSVQPMQQPFPTTNYSPQPPVPVLQHGFIPASMETTKTTRGPYIPVTLGPLNEANKNVRRSSRLYPMFHKSKRSLPNPINTPPSPIAPYDLVIGESVQNVPLERRVPIPTSPGPINSENYEEDSENVNNFIANLADNVKFSIPFNEQDNALENEKGQQMNGFSYNEVTTVPSFHVTYWMFYPYSQGKNMCTLSLGPFGRIPFPAVYGYCLGRKKDIGSHIGF